VDFTAFSHVAVNLNMAAGRTVAMAISRIYGSVFNNEAVVKAIVACPIPLISGIGHEIDTTLADLAAVVRAVTPSYAAEIYCPAKDELRERLPKLALLRQMLRQQV